MVNGMILADYLIKWFTTRKNLYSLIAFTLIMILLAANFSYWAGAIPTSDDEGDKPDGDEEEEEEVPWYYKLEVDESYSGTLLLPSGGTVKNPGVTVAYHDVEVPENSTLGFFNVSVSGNALRPDFDLRVYGPDGELVDQAATEAAEETLKIEYKVFNRTGAGTWRVEVDNYSSFNIGYTLTIQIHIRAPVEDPEKKEGD